MSVPKINFKFSGMPGPSGLVANEDVEIDELEDKDIAMVHN
jgi:hypothetical protein